MNIFNELFNMKSKEIKDFVKKLDLEETTELCIHGKVEKMIRDDKPEEIQIHYYDSIRIDNEGIWFYPEHGRSCYELISFERSSLNLMKNIEIEKKIEKKIVMKFTFWKKSTDDIFIDAAKKLIERGFSQDEAISFLEKIYCAMREEYGD